MRKKKIKKNMKDVSTFTFDPPPKKRQYIGISELM